MNLPSEKQEISLIVVGSKWGGTINLFDGIEKSSVSFLEIASLVLRGSSNISSFGTLK